MNEEVLGSLTDTQIPTCFNDSGYDALIRDRMGSSFLLALLIQSTIWYVSTHTWLVRVQ